MYPSTAGLVTGVEAYCAPHETSEVGSGDSDEQRDAPSTSFLARYHETSQSADHEPENQKQDEMHGRFVRLEHFEPTSGYED